MYHLDYPYLGWYATLVAHCEYGYLPYLFAEYEPEMGVMRMKRVKETTSVHDLDWFPLPPSPSYGQRLDPRLEPRWMQQISDWHHKAHIKGGWRAAVGDDENYVCPIAL